MGKEFGSWLYWQHYQWQSPNLNCGSFLPNLEQQNITNPNAYPDHANPRICSFSASKNAAGFMVPDDMESFCGEGLQAWVSCYPQQMFTPTPKAVPGEKFYVSQSGEPLANQKRFLGFDQSGNRKHLVSSSTMHLSNDSYLSNLKPFDARRSHPEPPIDKDTLISNFPGKGNWHGLDKTHEADALGWSGSEMHEDTEEINALLYSDEEEEEETSTGHCPSEMTAYKGNADYDSSEVASSFTPTKRRRNEVDNDPLVMDMANSVREGDDKDDAQSSCIKGRAEGGEGSSVSKRLKKARIRETLGILRSIIPGGKGKDAMVILDEAIQYLKSMRLKAKTLELLP